VKRQKKRSGEMKAIKGKKLESMEAVPKTEVLNQPQLFSFWIAGIVFVLIGMTGCENPVVRDLLRRPVYLANIRISSDLTGEGDAPYALSPVFEAGQLAYTVTAPYDAAKIYVEGIPEAGTQVDYARAAEGPRRSSGEFDFAEGAELEVEVRAWRDAMVEQVYKIRIIRGIQDARLEGLELYAGTEGAYFPGDLMGDQNFAPAGSEENGFSYRVTVRYDTELLRVEPKPQPGVRYVIKADGEELSGGETAFTGAETEIAVETSGDNMKGQTYVIQVSRDVPRAYIMNLKLYENGDPAKDLLKGYNFSYAHESYTVEIPYNTETVLVDAEAETEDLAVSYRVGGTAAEGPEIDLKGKDEAEIEVEVSHPQGYKAGTVYTVTLIRQLPTAVIEGLEVYVDGGSENIYTQEAGYIWNPMIRNYSIEVPYKTEEVKLKLDKGETPDAYVSYAWGTESGEDRSTGAYAERAYAISGLDRRTLADRVVEVTVGHEFLRSTTYRITLVRQTFTAYLHEDEGLKILVDGGTANAITNWINVNGTYGVTVPYNAGELKVQALVMEGLKGDGEVEVDCELDGAAGSGSVDGSGMVFAIGGKSLTGQTGNGVLMVTVRREYLSPMSYRVPIIRAAATAYLSGISVKGDPAVGPELMGSYY
jgi:hypothetical protein